MTIEVPLTRDLVALIDDDDADLVLPYKWRAQIQGKTAYVARTLPWIDGKRPCMLLHRFIMDVIDPEIQVDHEDGNGLDNRRRNLRVTNRNGNMQNCSMRKDNKTGLKGVGYNKRIDRYHARIFSKGKTIYLGSFVTPEEAHQEYCAAALNLFGEFAKFG